MEVLVKLGSPVKVIVASVALDSQEQTAVQVLLLPFLSRFIGSFMKDDIKCKEKCSLRKKSEPQMGFEFKSHLGLGFFSESTFLLTFNVMAVVVVIAVVVVVSSL